MADHCSAVANFCHAGFCFSRRSVAWLRSRRRCRSARTLAMVASQTASQFAAWLRSELASQQTRRPASVTESWASVQRPGRNAAQGARRKLPVDRLVQYVYASGWQAFVKSQARPFVHKRTEA